MKKPGKPIRVKLGTQPAMVYFHPEDLIESGKPIRYKEDPWEPYKGWKNAIVRDLSPIPFLEKM